MRVSDVARSTTGSRSEGFDSQPDTGSSKTVASRARETGAPSRQIVSRFSTHLISFGLILSTLATYMAGSTNRRSPRRTRMPLNVATVSGSTIRKLVPEQVVDSTLTDPPSFSTFSRTMARPSPRPEISVMIGLVVIPD